MTSAKARQHLMVPDGFVREMDFKGHSRGRKKVSAPELDRPSHAAYLKRQLELIRDQGREVTAQQAKLGLRGSLGIQISFESLPGVPLPFEQLASERQGIDLLSVNVLSDADGEKERLIANVFVPDGKLEHFDKLITEYLAHRKDKNGRSLDHRALVDAIATIRHAEIRALWTDELQQLPVDLSEAFWWEVWLPVRKGIEPQVMIDDFIKLANAACCRPGAYWHLFPERIVTLMHGSQTQLAQNILLLSRVCELRRAKESAAFFDSLPADEQHAWVKNLSERLSVSPSSANGVHVCLLDSGVNRGHPLLHPVLAREDLFTALPTGSRDDVHDTVGHGTSVAGLVAYGDLTQALTESEPIQLQHRLESVKVIDDQKSQPRDDPHLHAYVYKEAVARPEIEEPERIRVFASTITANDGREQGKPSSWSAAVDALAAGVDKDGEHTRLFIQSAGNINSLEDWALYPKILSKRGIQDPGQAWNAITVGAYTDKVIALSDDSQQNARPLARAGGLSPFTTTSADWDTNWPLKPDVVMEGGNAGRDDLGCVRLDRLELLAPYHRPVDRSFCLMNATSAACGLGAGFLGQLRAAYPHWREETVRALMVHSARWTPEMKRQFLPQRGNVRPTKEDHVHLIRHCGWGVPNLERALHSAANSLTLVQEAKLQPYVKPNDKSVRFRGMNLHELPWPRESLLMLGDAPATLRITLSYFVEPNPSARGMVSKYHYASHRLGFRVKRPTDGSTEAFLSRFNAAVEQEDFGTTGTDEGWCLGDRQRHRGSIHQDIWQGTAADLASMGMIAVYPRTGWWKTRPALNRVESIASYSLVATIETNASHIDLYTEVEAVIAKVQTKTPALVNIGH